MKPQDPKNHTFFAAVFPFAIGAVIIAAASCVTGCGSVRDNVPVTKFNAVLNGKPCSFTGPKDFKAKRVEFAVATNGTVSLVMEDIDARMNPDIISMTGEAYAKMRQADSQVSRDAVGLVKEFAPLAAGLAAP